MRDNKNKSKRTFVIILDLVIAISLAFSMVLGFKYMYEVYFSKFETEQSLVEIDKVLAEEITREEFEPVVSDAIFKLQVEGVTDWVPVIEGDSLVILNRGVGHVSQTGYPGDGNRQIFLAAHRETHFRGIGNAEPGDIVKVETPYGEFEYVVDRFEIVPETQVDVIKTGVIDTEELVLMTCYPFNSWNTSTERYLVYAYPKVD